MLELTTAIQISCGLIVYYIGHQLFSDFIRAGMAHNTPNRTIEKLRADYQVNIRTFQKNNRLRGFAWFDTIWINENLFKHKRVMMFTFHHEHYHLKNNHKVYKLLFRFFFALLPLLFAFVHWGIATAIIIGVPALVYHIEEQFEKNANKYAKDNL